jgi:hypothetical protein
MTDHAEKIRAGLARLEGGENWVKGALFARKPVHNGCGPIVGYCMIGSVVVEDHMNLECVNDAVPTLKIIADVIVEQYPEVIPKLSGLIDYSRNPPMVISAFNDSRNRPFADVERVMEKAAIKAEEMV